jgi:hypothetical protein
MTDTMAQAPAKRGEAQQVVVRPFIAGSRRTDEPDYDESQLLGAAEVRLQSWQISPNGYLRGIYLIVENVTAANAAAVTFAEDGPFNALSNINLQDTNSQPVVGPMSGYDLYVLNKYGGYAFSDDAKSSAVFSATTGAGATGGSFTFVLYVPVEIVARDALGAQPNKSGSSQFSLVLSTAVNATIYGVAPTTPGTMRVRGVLMGWQDPDSNDSRGNPTAQDPPAVQTSQYVHKQVYNSLAGAVNTRLQGIDGLLRGLIFINRRQSSTRVLGAADWPDPFTLKYENSLIIESRPRILWLHFIARVFGYAAAAEAAGGRDNGVFPVFEWMNDYGAKPGWESRFSYLPMSSASNLEIQGTFGPAQTDDLTVLVNKVVPFPQGNVRGLTGGR